MLVCAPVSVSVHRGWNENETVAQVNEANVGKLKEKNFYKKRKECIWTELAFNHTTTLLQRAK